MKWKKNAKWMLISALVLVYGYFVLIHLNTRSKLRNHGYWTTGVIINVERGNKGNLRFLYEFYDGNKKCTGDISENASYSVSGGYFINKSFPVVYYFKDPAVNRMLMTPYDFKFCGRDFPDSLNWVSAHMR